MANTIIACRRIADRGTNDSASDGASGSVAAAINFGTDYAANNRTQKGSCNIATI